MSVLNLVFTWIFYNKKRVISGFIVNFFIIFFVFAVIIQAQNANIVEFNRIYNKDNLLENGIISAKQSGNYEKLISKNIDIGDVPHINKLGLAYYNSYLKTKYNMKSQSWEVNSSIRTLTTSNIKIVILPEIDILSEDTFYSLKNITENYLDVQILNETVYKTNIEPILGDFKGIVTKDSLLFSHDTINTIYLKLNKTKEKFFVIEDYFQFSYKSDFPWKEILNSNREFLASSESVKYKDDLYTIEFFNEPEKIVLNFIENDNDVDIRIFMILLPIFPIFFVLIIFYEAYSKMLIKDTQLLRIGGHEDFKTKFFVLELFLVNIPTLLFTIYFFNEKVLLEIVISFYLLLLLVLFTPKMISLWKKEISQLIFLLTIISFIFGIFISIFINTNNKLFSQIILIMIFLIILYIISSLFRKLCLNVVPTKKLLKIKYYSFSFKAQNLLFIFFFLLNSLFFYNFISEDIARENKTFDEGFVCLNKENCLEYYLLNASYKGLKINLILTDVIEFYDIINGYQFPDYKIQYNGDMSRTSIISTSLKTNFQIKENFLVQFDFKIENQSLNVVTKPITSFEIFPGFEKLLPWILIDYSSISNLSFFTQNSTNLRLQYFGRSSVNQVEKFFLFFNQSEINSNFSNSTIFYFTIFIFISIYLIIVIIDNREYQDLAKNLRNVNLAFSKKRNIFISYGKIRILITSIVQAIIILISSGMVIFSTFLKMAGNFDHFTELQVRDFLFFQLIEILIVSGVIYYQNKRNSLN